MIEFWDGSWGWTTSTAAEYPAGLCEAVAEEYLKYKEVSLDPHYTTFDSLGTHVFGDQATNKQRRAEENRNCIGGMRRPHASLVQVPGWYKVGPKIRQIPEGVLDDYPDEETRVYGIMGDDNATGWCADIVEDARWRLEQAFQCGPQPSDTRRVHANLMAAITKEAKDPDDVLAKWAAGNTPLGIVNEIETRGIFPPTDAQTGDIGTLEEAENMSAWNEQVGNYSSVEENIDDVQTELKKEREKGFLRFSTSREALEKEVGKLILSRVAAVVTTKNGKRKVRLIHDLRRSQVNPMCWVPERTVLPRIEDAAWSMIGVAKDLTEDEGVEVLVIDFSDAFKHLIIDGSERRFLAGTATIDGQEGFFVYESLLFGVIPGPLLWGRMAAWLMRAAASLYPADRMGLQCYVDDPIMATRGTTKS